LAGEFIHKLQKLSLIVDWLLGNKEEMLSEGKADQELKKNPYSHDQPYMLLAPKIVPAGYLSVQEHAPGP